MVFIKEELKKVKAFAFDVDGVFSSTTALLHPSGEVMRTMNIKDGYIIHYAVKLGYPVAIITGGNSDAVAKRFRNLGVTDIYLSSSYKKDDLDDFIAKYDLDIDTVLYMGDDMPDFEVLRDVGFPVCPADAAEEIKAVCCYISDRKGGDGCVRDIVEQILKLHGKWMGKGHLIW